MKVSPNQPQRAAADNSPALAGVGRGRGGVASPLARVLLLLKALCWKVVDYLNVLIILYIFTSLARENMMVLSTIH